MASPPGPPTWPALATKLLDRERERSVVIERGGDDLVRALVGLKDEPRIQAGVAFAAVVVEGELFAAVVLDDKHQGSMSSLLMSNW